MSITLRKATAGAFAGIGLMALLAGCASAPSTDGGGSTGAASDFLPCMVSDAGGFTDKSFNQLGFEGLTAAAKELGVEPITVQSDKADDYKPNLQSLADQNCSLIVSVGFALSADTVTAAKANPDINYAIIDDPADNDFDGKVDAPNIKPILFDTVQAAFMAGYAAADYSKTGVVGTFGGQKFPSVTIFMDGFAEGVAYYNEQKGKSVQIVGWDVAAQTGSFTGGFEANDTAKQLARTLIDQNADVLMPVGGPIFLSAIAEIKETGKDVAMVGVDADLYETNPENKSMFLTSVLKDMKAGVSDTVMGASKGKFDATPYIGTLDNGGIGIAPFHDFESKVNPDLTKELDAIKKGIIDGSITVTSVSSPKK
ncbi:BMP family lipoprotein [Plantibacter sp. YIM 135347]|uniref:BMP family lipoprotein n=1 Tax=Plantibacter sp. YIM 135347 TaxID=3423919 RepID=UPI003D340586